MRGIEVPSSSNMRTGLFAPISTGALFELSASISAGDSLELFASISTGGFLELSAISTGPHLEYGGGSVSFKLLLYVLCLLWRRSNSHPATTIRHTPSTTAMMMPASVSIGRGVDDG